MGESAMLGEFGLAARVSDTHVWGHDNVGRARIYGWVIVVERKRRAVVDLAETDSSGGRRIIFENLDAGVGIGRVLQPDQRDVIFGRTDAGWVVRGFRKWDVACIGKQGDR